MLYLEGEATLGTDQANYDASCKLPVTRVWQTCADRAGWQSTASDNATYDVPSPGGGAGRPREQTVWPQVNRYCRFASR